jgi:hypothetical protein
MISGDLRRPRLLLHMFDVAKPAGGTRVVCRISGSRVPLWFFVELAAEMMVASTMTSGAAPLLQESADLGKDGLGEVVLLEQVAEAQD